MIKKTKGVSVFLSLCLIVSMLTSMVPASAVSSSMLEATSNADYYEDYVAPDIIDKDELKTTDYVGRVPEDENDLYTFIFKNGDGSNTMRVFSHPVKYIDDDGATRDISLEICKSKDGTFTAADHMIKTDFGSSISDGMSLEYNDIRVSMKVLDANENVNADLSDDGKKLTYAVDDKTSYVYSLTYLGIKEDIVVSEYTGQTEYDFSLFTNGLHPVRIDDSIFLANVGGDIKATIGDILIFTADERNNSFGDLHFEPIVENEEYAFTIILNDDYLKNEKTAYPITIDPTIEINYSNNGAGAIEDVTINENVTFSGTSGSLYVGRHPAGSLSRTLMRFPNLDLSVISSGFYIDDASVEIRDLMCQGDEDITVDCCIYNNSSPSWSESGTTTWSSVGTSYVGTVLDSLLISYGNGMPENSQRYSFDITNVAKSWKSGTQSPSKGLVFKANPAFEGQTGTNIKTWYKTFASYNRASYKPSLKITYRHGISLNYSTLTLNVGDSRELSTSAIMGYTPTNYSLRWEISNSRVAYLSSTSGYLYARACGRVTVKVYFLEDPTVYATFVLVVNPSTSPVSSLTSGCVYMIKNVSKNKYLSASSSTNVTVENKNVMDGKQLWYVEWMGSGYRLYSLGIKDASSNGTYETALRGNTANNSPRVQANYPSTNKWSIHLYNGYYYLTCTLYDNTSISTNSSNNNVKHISLSSETEYARWSFEKIETATFNNYWTGTYSGQGSTVYVKINIDDSGSDSVYLNSYISSTDFDVIDQWKNRSSHVIVYGPNDTVPSGITPFQITFVGYTPSGGSYYESHECGVTHGYKKIAFIEYQTDPDQDWTKVIISLNTCSSSPLNGDTDLIRMTIIHELGHALKLAHPKHAAYTQSVTNGRGAYADDNCVCAVMNQGSPSDPDPSLTCATPKWHDLINLKNKWGN